MNERIKDLAEKIIVESPCHDKWVFNDKELEQFAQAIIAAECKPTVPQIGGWICPTCGGGNAPWSSRCGCKVFLDYKVTC